MAAGSPCRCCMSVSAISQSPCTISAYNTPAHPALMQNDPSCSLPAAATGHSRVPTAGLPHHNNRPHQCSCASSCALLGGLIQQHVEHCGPLSSTPQWGLGETISRLHVQQMHVLHSQMYKMPAPLGCMVAYAPAPMAHNKKRQVAHRDKVSDHWHSGGF